MSMARSQGFRSPRRRAGYFSLLAQRKGNQKKGRPGVPVAGHPVRRLRERVAGFVDGTSCAATNARASLHAPLGLSPPPARRDAKGTRVKRSTRAPARAGRSGGMARPSSCSSGGPLQRRRAADEKARRVGAMDRAHCAVSAGMHCRRNPADVREPAGLLPAGGAVGCPSLW